MMFSVLFGFAKVYALLTIGVIAVLGAVWTVRDWRRNDREDIGYAVVILGGVFAALWVVGWAIWTRWIA